MNRFVRLLVPVVAALVMGAGCGVSFPVNIDAKSTIPGGGLFSQIVPNQFADFTSLDLSQSQDFKNAGVAKDHVDSAKLTSVTLSIVSPAGGTFEWLDDVAFFVETDGQPKKQIAHKTGIPNDATKVSLDVDGVELAPYIRADKMSITTSATAHAPREDTKIDAALVFDVDPRVF
jgi:hypothetical protein